MKNVAMRVSYTADMDELIVISWGEEAGSRTQYIQTDVVFRIKPAH